MKGNSSMAHEAKNNVPSHFPQALVCQLDRSSEITTN